MNNEVEPKLRALKCEENDETTDHEKKIDAHISMVENDMIIFRIYSNGIMIQHDHHTSDAP
jgi:hypothetical protein